MAELVIDSYSDEYKDLPLRGQRVLDREVDEAIEQFDNSNYDLLIRDYPYTFTEANSSNIPDHVQPNMHEKGRIKFGKIDAADERIDVVTAYIPSFERDKLEQLRTLGESIELVNETAGTDWEVFAHARLEEPAYFVPDHEYDRGVYTTPEAMETLRESESFAELSRHLFGGALEISSEEMLEKR